MRTCVPLSLLVGLAMAVASCTSDSTSTPTGDPRPSDVDTAAGDDATGDSSTGDGLPGDSNAGDPAQGDVGPGDSPSGDTSRGDGATPPVRGSCVDSDDCGGNACLRIPDITGGWNTCSAPRTEATGCGNPTFDECCDSSECLAGRCFETPIWFCGGMLPQPYNVCVDDECTASVSCLDSPGALCVPASAFGEHSSRCTYGNCMLDGDCASRSGGRCLPFTDPCTRRLLRFACTYDDSVCRVHSDCTGGGIGTMYCAPGTDGNTTCEEFLPFP